MLSIFTFAPSYLTAFNRWQAAELQEYTFVVGYGTDFGIYNSIDVTVTDGVTRSVTNSTTHISSIDSLFENILRSCVIFPFGFASCTVEYDPIYGYPTRFHFVDLDLGYVILIRDFRVLDAEPHP